MTLNQLAQWLECHIRALETACVEVNTEQLKSVRHLATKHSSVTVKTLVFAIETVEVKVGESQSCQELYDSVSAFVDAARIFGKAADVKSLDAFAQALAKRKEEDFAELVNALDQKLDAPARNSPNRRKVISLSEEDIDTYVDRLEAALGDEANFDKLFQQLNSNKNIKATDAKNIAKKFVGKAGKSKADAFRMIYERHSSLIGARERAVATGGRSAA